MSSLNDPFSQAGLANLRDRLHSIAPTCVHVGGLEGELEDEEVLSNLLSQFGRLLAVTVRIRREGKKVSWALVSFSSGEEADNCLAGTASLSAKYPGIVARHVDEEQARAAHSAAQRDAALVAQRVADARRHRSGLHIPHLRVRVGGRWVRVGGG